MPMMPRALRSSLLHGEYVKADACYRFAPLDVPLLRTLQTHWDSIRLHIAGETVQCDLFNGLHFSRRKFESFLKTHDLDSVWPRTEKSQARKLDKDTWEEMAALNAVVRGAYERYKTLTMPKLNVACDKNGRNRMYLRPFGTITSRNAPGNDDRGRFIFSLPKWTRSLIRPPEGWALAYIDWHCQEFGIGAVLSGDQNMLRSYEAGDPYLAFAKLAGAAPQDATKESHGQVRALYKTATLAISYGQSPYGFSRKAGVPSHTAKKVFAAYKQVYSRFCAWREEQTDHYALHGELGTKLGWNLHRGRRVKPNLILNFPMQTTGAEMLRLAVIEMMEQGVEVCCPVHDAVLIQAPVHEIEDAVRVSQDAMRRASACLLDGFELESECKEEDIVRFPDRFNGRKPADTWEKVMKSMASLSVMSPGC